MGRRTLIIFLLLVHSLACRSARPLDDTSQSLGVTGIVDEAFSLPQPKKAAEIKTFSDKIKAFFGQKSAPHSLNKTQKKSLLGQAFLKALIVCGGIHRDQGEGLLKELVASKSAQCGGASCAQIFGVSEKEVPQFFDDLLADVGTSKALAKKERHHTRRTVIASLVPTAAFQNIDDPSAQVARLYFESPSPLPKQGPIPEGLLSTDDIRERTGEEFIDAIRDYTALHDFMYIRRVESLDQTSLKKLGMSEKEISLWRSKSDLIHTGIKKLPIIETPVYRGLVGLNEETIGLWYSAWKARKAIGLGFDNQGALSSASWQVKGATEFIMPNLMPGGTTSKYAVLLEIRSHRGVSIEHISEIPDEFEVLLPRDQKVIIEHMSFVSGARKTILIKMRGVDSASVSIRERKLRVA